MTLILATRILIIIAGIVLTVSMTLWGIELWRKKTVGDPETLAIVLWILALFNANSMIGLVSRLISGV